MSVTATTSHTSGQVRIGQPVRRLEDAALLTGRGRFVDDIDLPGEGHAQFVRSPHAHARIVAIDTTAAAAAPGVIGVFTGADVTADGVGGLFTPSDLTGKGGKPLVNLERPAMPAGTASHVGDTVAMVVAETPDLARDAAEMVMVDYEELPAVTDARAALAPGAPRVRDEAPGNLAVDWEGGNREATEQAFRRAAHVTRLDLRQNRLVVSAVEPRGALAAFDPETGRTTIHAPTQGPNAVHAGIARYGLKVANEQIRLITPEVGGGFGMKNYIYPEYILVAWAARKLGRPVKWYATRSESFLTDGQARDHFALGELALDTEGRFLAIRSRMVSNMGAYSTFAAPNIPTRGGTRCITGVYTIPTYYAETKVAFTNTAPIQAYRGAGKPEFIYLLERLVDAAAGELGIDPAELRRRNIVGPEAMPYATPTGLVFDSGEFETNMDDALALADRAGFVERRADACERGRLRGFGFSLYQEPDGYMDNRVDLAFDEAGRLSVAMSAQTNGQGHATTFAQVVADRLGLSLAAITVIQGDTDRVGEGGGTGGSHTATLSATAIVEASAEIVAKGREIAAHLLEASAADIEFAKGAFVIAGTDRRLALAEVARAAFDPAKLPQGMAPGLAAGSHYVAPVYNYPSGCHVAEVEIDPETGGVELVAYAAVNDFGVVINPMLLEGQVHGGVTQGIGQTLLEDCVYDAQSGQLLTGSFADYALPRADDVPFFAWARNEVPCKTNPLGVKGCGESGCTASLAAVMNAVVDAVAPLGITHVDMPATPEKVWRAIRTRHRTCES